MRANTQGSFYKTLSITRNEESTSNHMLKVEFLKKASNYTCMVRDFITNITPPLNLIGEAVFRIRVRGQPGQTAAQAVFPAFWRPEDAEFRPTPYHSTIEFLRQAQTFFHKFTFLARFIGISPDAGPAVGTLQAILNTGFLGAAGRAEGYPYIKSNYVGGVNRGWRTLQRIVNGEDYGVHPTVALVKARMKSDGKLQIECSRDFLSNFYLEVGPETQRILGYPPILYAIMQANGQLSFTEDLFTDQPAPNAPQFSVLSGNAVGAGNPVERNSLNAMHQLDERLSLDIVGTLPISNRIISFDGDEEHEYLVARFPLNDYNSFETKLESAGGRILDNVTVAEEVNVGLEDMTQKSPSSSAIYMLPGSVQQVNFRLFTRYASAGKIVSESTRMGNGFWTLKLLFGKKV